MSKQDAGRKQDRPTEIPMTDLGWSAEGEVPADPAAEQDIYAAGTPGGGAASGGLAGSNSGDGDPDNVGLEDAMGNGLLDNEGEDVSTSGDTTVDIRPRQRRRKRRELQGGEPE